MRRVRRDLFSAPAVAFGLLTLLAGCASQQLSASAGDQTFEPGQSPIAEAPPASRNETRAAEVPVQTLPPPAEEPRVIEAVPPPPVSAEPAPATAAPDPELAEAHFDFDKAGLRADARAALESNARVLRVEMKDASILIEGHCDEIGTTAYNLILGEKRAHAVRQYLTDLGIASSRMQITSYGKERPFCTEHSPDCWQKNRRAHFVVK